MHLMARHVSMRGRLSHVAMLLSYICRPSPCQCTLQGCGLTICAHAGAMMGFSSLAVMANSMLLHLEAGRASAGTANAITLAPQQQQSPQKQLYFEQHPAHSEKASTSREPQPISG